MGKVLTWVLIAALAWLAWRLVVISRRRASGAGTADSSARKTGHSDTPPEQIVEPERILQCARCGIHLPATEGRFAGGRFYCSEAHRDAGAPGPADAAARPDRNEPHDPV